MINNNYKNLTRPLDLDVRVHVNNEFIAVKYVGQTTDNHVFGNTYRVVSVDRSDKKIKRRGKKGKHYEYYISVSEQDFPEKSNYDYCVPFELSEFKKLFKVQKGIKTL